MTPTIRDRITASPVDLLAKASTHERQSNECFRSGLYRAAQDHSADAKNLRRLAAEARMGE